MSSKPDKTKLFPHYFKATEHLDEVDVYQVLNLFDTKDPSTSLGHAVKKILLPGERGAKGRKQDITEAIRSLERYLEINYPEPKPSQARHEKLSYSMESFPMLKDERLPPVREPSPRIDTTGESIPRNNKEAKKVVALVPDDVTSMTITYTF